MGRGKSPKKWLKTPAKDRSDVIGNPSLFGDEFDDFDDADPDALAAAFVSRWCDCEYIYGRTFALYSEAAGDLDTTLGMLKTFYKRYVCELAWTEEKYFRVSEWLLENRFTLSMRMYARGSRMYDTNELPWGAVDKMKARDYKYIVGLTNAR